MARIDRCCLLDSACRRAACAVCSASTPSQSAGMIGATPQLLCRSFACCEDGAIVTPHTRWRCALRRSTPGDQTDRRRRAGGGGYDSGVNRAEWTEGPERAVGVRDGRAGKVAAVTSRGGVGSTAIVAVTVTPVCRAGMSSPASPVATGGHDERRRGCAAQCTVCRARPQEQLRD